MGLTITIELTEEMLDAIANRVIKKTAVVKPFKKEKLKSVKEVADYLGKSERTIYRNIKSGFLIAEKVGKEYLVSETNLNNFINGVSE
jgi:excisionase family DNA binding protein